MELILTAAVICLTVFATAKYAKPTIRIERVNIDKTIIETEDGVVITQKQIEDAVQQESKDAPSLDSIAAAFNEILHDMGGDQR